MSYSKGNVIRGILADHPDATDAEIQQMVHDTGETVSSGYVRTVAKEWRQARRLDHDPATCADSRCAICIGLVDDTFDIDDKVEVDGQPAGTLGDLIASAQPVQPPEGLLRAFQQAMLQGGLPVVAGGQVLVPPALEDESISPAERAMLAAVIMHDAQAMFAPQKVVPRGNLESLDDTGSFMDGGFGLLYEVAEDDERDMLLRLARKAGLIDDDA